jgi:S1-C subfamily serine protease
MAIKGHPCRLGFDRMTNSASPATNLDVMTLPGPSSNDGVIHNRDGEVLGFYACFGGGQARGGGRPPDIFLGIPAAIIGDIIEPIRAGLIPQYRSLGARLEYIALSQLRKLGLPDDIARKIEVRADKEYLQRQAVVVSQRWDGTHARSVLHDGDVLLTVDGKSIVTVSSVDAALADTTADHVTVELFRPGVGHKKIEVDVFDGTEGRPLPLERVVLWAGSALSSPPALVRWLWHVGDSGVYVASTAMGSPARHHKLAPGSMVVEVDGQPTPTLDRFVEVVNSKRDGESLRIKAVSMRGKVTMTTLTLDRAWWPTHDVRRLPDGQWQRTEVNEQVGGTMPPSKL